MTDPTFEDERELEAWVEATETAALCRWFAGGDADECNAEMAYIDSVRAAHAHLLKGQDDE